MQLCARCVETSTASLEERTKMLLGIVIAIVIIAALGWALVAATRER